ncbi:MAG: hypothetical protein U1F68_10295 [Gammaproteobacteria bacterium]
MAFHERALLAHLYAHGLHRAHRRRQFDFAVGFTLERDLLGFSDGQRSLTMAFAQVRQQIHFLLVRNRGIGIIDFDACLTQLHQ